MPIYLDSHIEPGISTEIATKAHIEDLKLQNEFGCHILTYWVDKDKDCAFCLIEAPNKEAIDKMHDKSFGAKHLEIIEVNSNAIEVFLGRILGPETPIDLEYPELKIINDLAFRLILIVEMLDKKLLQTIIDKEKVGEKIKGHDENMAITNEESIVSSLISSFQAIRNALAIQEELLKNRQHINIFSNLLYHKNDYKKTVDVHELNLKFIKNVQEFALDNKKKLSVCKLANSLFTSRTQLHRKIKGLTGMSITQYFNHIRIERSKYLLITTQLTICEIAYEVGYISPEYFSKIFKKLTKTSPILFRKTL